MQIETSRDYHMRRARVELDLAYRADVGAAMVAHLKLSALHMARLREEEAPGPSAELAPALHFEGTGVALELAG
jgi:hypothetical protein